MRDFIITSLQTWDIEIGSTIKNTALEISKQNRVLYINTPMDISIRLRGNRQSPSYIRRMAVIKGETSPLRQINANMWVLDCPFMLFSANFLPAPLFNIVNRKNNARIARWIVEQAAALDFKNYIHLIDTDIYRSRYLKEYIHPSVSIYYRRDYVIGEAYWRRHGTRLEPELAASADLVLANSTRFAAELQAYNPHTYPIETGVNLKLYNPAKKYETPGDMQDIPRPIIGYMGTINSTRLDGDLLYQIISQRPDYSFVFTGPEDDIFRRNRIHSLKNAYFTGQKKVDELPAYIAAYDVCINPQMVNEITDGNYPLKIDEYLAMGKPTVATSTHTMRHIFANHTHLATTPEEWLSAIDRAVTEADDEELAKQRIAFAETHSWGHSVKKIYDIIDNFLGDVESDIFEGESYMNYRNIDDLNHCILQHLSILPRDFDLIVGVPRSGMFPANLLALYLNLPVTDIDSFRNGHIYQTGERGKTFNMNNIHNVLVVDDSIATGKAMKKCRELLKDIEHLYNIQYCVIYAVPLHSHSVDYFFEIVDYPRFFQWNIMNHSILQKTCMDIDGVLCADPTPEENDDGEKYRHFLLNTPPLFIPKVTIGTLVTSRLEKYRPETEAWLQKNHVKYNKLVMLNLPDMAARQRANCHASFKAKEYGSSTDNMLFVESSMTQAVEINRLTKKPVLCTETFQMIYESKSLYYNLKSGETFPWLRRFMIRMRNKLSSHSTSSTCNNGCKMWKKFFQRSV
mgnify:CR=1 FL=1